MLWRPLWNPCLGTVLSLARVTGLVVTTRTSRTGAHFFLANGWGQAEAEKFKTNTLFLLSWLFSLYIYTYPKKNVHSHTQTNTWMVCWLENDPRPVCWKTSFSVGHRQKMFLSYCLLLPLIPFLAFCSLSWQIYKHIPLSSYFFLADHCLQFLSLPHSLPLAHL